MSITSYGGAHARVRMERGRAEAHTCVSCPKPAAEWAYDHTDPNSLVSAEGFPFSTDVSRYKPMCKSCHRFEDTARLGMSKCGTEGGYYRHRKRGQQTCQPCRDAHTAATRQRLLARTAAIHECEVTA